MKYISWGHGGEWGCGPRTAGLQLVINDMFPYYADISQYGCFLLASIVILLFQRCSLLNKIAMQLQRND